MSPTIATLRSPDLQCSPPVAANANTPTVTLGTATYTWSCKTGFYGTPQSRTCSSTTGAWSGIAPTCLQCSPPSAPSGGTVVQVNTNTWQYSCAAGYYATATAPASLVCSTSSGFTTTPPACYGCGASFYCLGGMSRTACPAGTWASPAAINLQTSTCSGLCLAGYYCPAGSTNNAPFKCGSIDKYCPTGSGAPITILASDNTKYTGPLSVQVDVREQAIACPAYRKCAGGVLFPAVVVDYLPGNGVWGSDATIMEDKNNTVTTMTAVTFSTPTNDAAQVGPYPLTVTVLEMRATTPGCSWPPGNDPSYLTWDAPSGKLRVGARSLTGDNCGNTWQVKLRVARTMDATLFVEFFINLITIDANMPPVIAPGTCSQAREVFERSPPGTVVGSRIVADDPDKGQQTLWSITTQLTPFRVDACSGQLYVDQDRLDNAVKATWTLAMSVKDTGTPSLSLSCNVIITVLDRNDPPVIGKTALSIRENTPLGAWAGNILATDPDVGSVLTYSILRADTSDHFRIDPANGDMLVKVAALDFETKASYVYKVQVSDGTNLVPGDIVISLLNANE